MKTKITSGLLVIPFLMLALFISCSKQKISPNKLKGETYTVQDVAIYEGTNYATWKNVHEGGTMDGGLNITSSEGYMSFSDDGEADFNIVMQNTDPSGTVTTGTHINSGTLVMDGRQDWFDIEGGPLGYQQYFIEEKNGKELIIVWEQLFGQYGNVYFFKVKR